MFPSWVKRQIDDVIAKFVKDPPVTIGVLHIQDLERAYFRHPGAKFELLPALPASEGFVWRPAPRDGLPQLWLSPTKTGYRAAFENFARRELGAPGLAGAGVHIDHMFPKKAGALGGLRYVRMLAVPPDSNMAAGRTMEKEMVARNEELGPRGKPTRNATFITIGKATGFAGWESLPDEDAAGNAATSAALLAHLRAWGLPPDILGGMDRELTAATMARQR